MAAQGKFITNVLYTLKKEYGKSIVWRHMTGSTVNTISGRTGASYDTYRIKGIPLTRTIMRMPQLQALPGFKDGGNYNTAQQSFILDTRDLVKAGADVTRPKEGDLLIVESLTYIVKSLEGFEFDRSLLVVVERIDSDTDIPEGVLTVISLTQGIGVGQEQTYGT